MTTDPWQITEAERERLREHKRIWQKIEKGWRVQPTVKDRPQRKGAGQ